MDRRQQKTRQAIFDALSQLLRSRRYENITVQEIIDLANIGRSTFYAHFETKDELLHAMCTDIFQHVFSGDLMTHKTSDLPGNIPALQGLLSHTLYHLRDNAGAILGALSSESSQLFMRYFRDYTIQMFDKFLVSEPENVPREFVLNHLSGGFAEAVRWWVRQELRCTPEEVAAYFCACLGSFV